MTTLAPAKRTSDFCDEDFEYSDSFLVTMPDGFQFVTQCDRLASKMIAEKGAKIDCLLLVNLGE
jgi:hypothetical protein